jgi:hypothetical protein
MADWNHQYDFSLPANQTLSATLKERTRMVESAQQEHQVSLLENVSLS